MLRIAFVAGFGLLTLVGLVLSDRLGAQQESAGGDATARSSEHSALSAEDRIDATLDGKLKAPLEFLDAPLLDVVAQLEEEYEIPIHFDRSALDEVAISSDTEVTIDISKVTLRSALDLILWQPGLEGLTTTIDKEVLLITTEDRANKTLLTKVYRVDDFERCIDSKSESSTSTNCYTPLQEVITHCVEYDSWQVNGGEGQLDLMKPGILIVIQTHSVHRKIVKLLANLRKVKSDIELKEKGVEYRSR